ncbi:MAG TPA: DUF6326 family protein [Pyrinomonadaceae bacterium]|nr:DUF6326 family protein [Pyrinomonadaceae bacterium]
MKQAGTALHDIKIHVKIKISALWASAMCCYIYGDFFLLYQPGKLQEMLEGKMAPFGPTTQGVLVGTSISMAIPALMIFLSLALKANLSRWLNIILGALYSLFVLVTMPGAWAFYLFMGSVDILITSLIVWYAWTWPKQETASQDT